MTRAGERYFLVERYIPSTSAAAIEAATERLAASGDSAVHHLVTLVVPDEETCLSIFQAADADAVAALNRRADFPLDRIVEVRLLSLPGWSTTMA
jgi:hypothetical protein